VLSCIMVLKIGFVTDKVLLFDINIGVVI
jgi:hypothetical protein